MLIWYSLVAYCLAAWFLYHCIQIICLSKLTNQVHTCNPHQFQDSFDACNFNFVAWYNEVTLTGEKIQKEHLLCFSKSITYINEKRMAWIKIITFNISIRSIIIVENHSLPWGLTRLWFSAQYNKAYTKRATRLYQILRSLSFYMCVNHHQAAFQCWCIPKLNDHPNYVLYEMLSLSKIITSDWSTCS